MTPLLGQQSARETGGEDVLFDAQRRCKVRARLQPKGGGGESGVAEAAGVENRRLRFICVKTICDKNRMNMWANSVPGPPPLLSLPVERILGDGNETD